MGVNYGVITDDPDPQSWQLDCIQHLKEEGKAQLRCLFQVIDPVRPPAQRDRSWQQLLAGSPTTILADLRLAQGQLDSGSLGIVQQQIKSLGLDFILLLAPAELGTRLTDCVRFGVWYFVWSDSSRFVSQVAYFWETYFDHAVSGAFLLRLRAANSLGTVLKSGYFPTFRGNHDKSVRAIFDSASKWPALVCRELQAGVADYFDDSPRPRPSVQLGVPTPLQILRFNTMIAARTMLNSVRVQMSRFFWNVAITADGAGQFLEGDHAVDVSLLLPHDMEAYLADPCVFKHNGRVYVFCEKFSYKTNLGTLVVFEMENGQASSPATVIAEGFHLSYPQIFTYQNEIYCMPESAAVRKVLLYKATDFPNRWELSRVLIDDFSAHDSTLIEQGGTWWLFCTSQDEGYNSHLYLWYALDLMGPWQPHAQNPVKIDVRSAGPAGRIIVRDGVLFRPAQDCSRSYGERVVINRIDRLTSSQFKESVVASLRPSAATAYKYGLHTLSALDDRYVVDVLKYEFVPSGIINVARTLLSHAVRGVGIPEASIRKIKKNLGLKI